MGKYEAPRRKHEAAESGKKKHIVLWSVLALLAVLAIWAVWFFTTPPDNSAVVAPDEPVAEQPEQPQPQQLPALSSLLRTILAVPVFPPTTHFAFLSLVAVPSSVTILSARVMLSAVAFEQIDPFSISGLNTFSVLPLYSIDWIR